MTGSASKAEKVATFTKSTFPKKGVGKFSQKNTFLESPRRQLSSGTLR